MFLSKQAKCFIEVAKAESLTRAAEKLNITTAAVSYNMNALQRDIGVDLFSREGRGMKITKAGSTLMNKLIDINDRINLILKDIEENDHYLKTIKIGVDIFFCPDISDVIIELETKFNSRFLTTRLCQSDDLIDYDIAIKSAPLTGETSGRSNGISLGVDSLSLVLSDIQLTNDLISNAHILNSVTLFQSENIYSHKIFKTLIANLKKHGVIPHVIVVPDSMDVLESILNCRGGTIIPSALARHPLIHSSGLRVVNNPLPFDFFIQHSAHFDDSKPELIDYIQYLK